MFPSYAVITLTLVGKHVIVTQLHVCACRIQLAPTAREEDKKAAKVVSFLQLRGSHNHLSDSDKAASDKLSPLRARTRRKSSAVVPRRCKLWGKKQFAGLQGIVRLYIIKHIIYIIMCLYTSLSLSIRVYKYK